jgi:hypothetical protein
MVARHGHANTVCPVVCLHVCTYIMLSPIFACKLKNYRDGFDGAAARIRDVSNTADTLYYTAEAKRMTERSVDYTEDGDLYVAMRRHTQYEYLVRGRFSCDGIVTRIACRTISKSTRVRLVDRNYAVAASDLRLHAELLSIDRDRERCPNWTPYRHLQFLPSSYYASRYWRIRGEPRHFGMVTRPHAVAPLGP